MSSIRAQVLANSSASIAVALLALSLATTEALADTYFMDGKPVPREFSQAGPLINDGTALLRSNRNQEAADKLSQAVKIAPQFAVAHHDYALALAKLGKTATALQEFKIALDLDPNLDSAWLSMGGLYQSSGNIAEAVKAYKEYLTRFPSNPDAPKVSALIQALQREGQREESRPPRGPITIAALQPSATTTPPAQSAAPVDDYFADVTRDGVVRWPLSQMPLRIYIHDGFDVPGYKEAYGHILRQSFEDWSKASNDVVKFVEINDPKSADIECFWQSDDKKLQSSAEAGEARLMVNSKGIVRCIINLLTVPPMPGMPMTENRIRQMSLHEIGHALGLRGHTTDPRDSMFFTSSVEDQWKDLSQRDANTIKHLYRQN